MADFSIKGARTLNGDFGVMLDDVTPRDLVDATFQREARALWTTHGGLLAVRGEALATLSPDELMDWAGVFGAVENRGLSARERSMVPGYPILRIGNIRGDDGKLKATLSQVPILESDADIQYNPTTRRPVWHTDSTFRSEPPIGSVFHCKQAPNTGGDTLFADTHGAYQQLNPATQEHLADLEAVCSLAHHDKKISLYSPEYPVLTPEQRAANPPNRVPVVLHHPDSGRPALYGLNSSTCAVVRKGQAVSPEAMDRYDLEGEEDESVQVLRELLPFITSPAFTVRWHWQPGDILVWDNRCTVHAASGFDYDTGTREMWRLTLLEPAGARTGRA
ncbi:MAG: TauD/TfdA family dioxygenase [Pseudomonadota bacterium]